MVNWQTDQTISAPTTSTDAWSCDVLCVPNPVAFYRATITDDALVPLSSQQTGINTQLGTTFTDATAALLETYERWRIAYYSVTAYYDAPALADQGSVVCAQFPLEANLTGGPGYLTAVPTPAGHFCQYKVGMFQARDFPVFEKLRTMPNAYSGLAKDGVYMPLRLDSNHQKWNSEKDCFVDASLAHLQAGSDVERVVTDVDIFAALFPDVAKGLHVAAGGPTKGDVVPGLASGISGQMSFRNLAKVGKLRLVFRVGFECMASPGSAMTPFLRVSPPYDFAAISAYYQVSRELKDAYPADYNDLGKLWDVIKRVGSVVAPLVPAPLRMIGSVAANAIDSIRTPRTEREMKKSISAPRDSPPAATTERAQRLNASSLAAVKRRIARRK